MIRQVITKIILVPYRVTVLTVALLLLTAAAASAGAALPFANHSSATELKYTFNGVELGSPFENVKKVIREKYKSAYVDQHHQLVIPKYAFAGNNVNVDFIPSADGKLQSFQYVKYFPDKEINHETVNIYIVKVHSILTEIFGPPVFVHEGEIRLEALPHLEPLVLIKWKNGAIEGILEIIVDELNIRIDARIEPAPELRN